MRKVFAKLQYFCELLLFCFKAFEEKCLEEIKEAIHFCISKNYVKA
jgi:hypothetical protein